MHLRKLISRRGLRPVFAIAALGLLVACAQSEAPAARSEPYDPYEAQNRKIHAFNVGLDRALVRPVSKGYSAAIPDDIETVIGRFAFNVSIPGAVVNNVLQGQMRAAISDTARFAVNSTVGLGGFFDPATEMGMPAASDADFGQTLYVWGVPAGAYRETPFIGPGTNRRIAGRIVDLFTNPLEYILHDPEIYYPLGAKISSGMTSRARYADTIDSVLDDSADSYAATRSFYLQNRRFKLNRGEGSALQDPYDTTFGAEGATAPANTSNTYGDPYDEISEN